jgi:hypothetical protein
MDPDVQVRIKTGALLARLLVVERMLSRMSAVEENVHGKGIDQLRGIA